MSVRTYHKLIGSERYYIATSTGERSKLKRWGWIKVYARELPKLLGVELAARLTKHNPAKVAAIGTFFVARDARTGGAFGPARFVYEGCTTDHGRSAVGGHDLPYPLSAELTGQCYLAFQVEHIERRYRELTRTIG